LRQLGAGMGEVCERNSMIVMHQLEKNALVS
jgi:hypothetical protein